MKRIKFFFLRVVPVLIIVLAIASIVPLSNNSFVAYSMSFLYKNNPEKEIFWLQKAADLGDAAATNDLGYRYSIGQGVPKNYQKALELFQLAADRGDYAGMYNLGLAYSHLDQVNKPTPVDYPAAIRWYERSMKADPNSCAANDLGILYATGKGTQQNPETAKAFFKKAAELTTQDKANTVLINDFVQYKYSEATQETDNAASQNISPENVKLIKKMSETIVQMCWQ